jgi:hypothetical protein
MKDAFYKDGYQVDSGGNYIVRCVETDPTKANRWSDHQLIRVADGRILQTYGSRAAACKRAQELGGNTRRVRRAGYGYGNYKPTLTPLEQKAADRQAAKHNQWRADFAAECEAKKAKDEQDKKELETYLAIHPTHAEMYAVLFSPEVKYMLDHYSHTSFCLDDEGKTIRFNLRRLHNKKRIVTIVNELARAILRGVQNSFVQFSLPIGMKLSSEDINSWTPCYAYAWEEPGLNLYAMRVGKLENIEK